MNKFIRLLLSIFVSIILLSTSILADKIKIGTEGAYLDDSDGLAPVGVPGEICAAGDGLARGYLHNAELTQARFTPHPFENGKRIYHTGDLGRWRADGAIEYLGRIDDQVKIRGYRVEPREIETCLLRDPRVTETLVLARDFGDRVTMNEPFQNTSNKDYFVENIAHSSQASSGAQRHVTQWRLSEVPAATGIPVIIDVTGIGNYIGA